MRQVDYTLTDETELCRYHRADGYDWRGKGIRKNG